MAPMTPHPYKPQYDTFMSTSGTPSILLKTTKIKNSMGENLLYICIDLLKHIKAYERKWKRSKIAVITKACIKIKTY